MRLTLFCEREHEDRGSLPDAGWFKRFKSRARSVLRTGNLNGVASIQTDERYTLIKDLTRAGSRPYGHYIKSEYPYRCIFQISYVDEVQMNFLRLLHNEAHQLFTYFCRNSVAWHNAETASYDLAVALVGANGQDMPTEKFSQRDVQVDGCSVSSPRYQTITSL